MKTRIALAICCTALVTLLNSNAATIQVKVGAGGLKFTPQDVTIQLGDTVQWTWSKNGHSSTSGTPDNPNGIWDSGVQNKGFTFSQTFNTAGTFPYYCMPHGSCCGMIGSVTVAGAPPPAAGYIFINGNGTANQVWMYSRASNGQLSLVGAFSTQGTGARFKLSSQGSIALAQNNAFLYVANPNSNDITAFKVASTGLTFIGKVPSMGTFPNSIVAFGDLLYVLNSKGTAANITGFRIQTNGSLVLIPNSTRALSTARPESAQVGFTPDGKTLLVSEKNTDSIDTYAVGVDGLATGPTMQPAGNGSFGFAWDNAGHLVVANIITSSASSYTVTNGIIHVVTPSLQDKGKAACWTACTNTATLPQQYAYLSNTNSDTISGYSIAPNGALSLLNSDGKTAILPTGAFAIDSICSAGSQYYYVLEGNLPGIGCFQINPTTGALTQIQTATGIPTSSSGLTGY